MVAITISRQYGSGGRKIATQIAEMLEYEFFDKRLMVKVARDVGISERELVDFSEEDYKAKGFFDRLFGSSVVAEVSTSSRDAGGQERRMVRKMDEEEAVDLVRSSVLAAYNRGKVVIVGRGGQQILQHQRDVFHVRVIAPHNVRRQRLVEFEHYAPYETRAIIAERDSANKEYHRRFYDADLDDPTLYHLIVNTGKMTTDEAAHLIVAAYKQFQSTLMAAASA